MECGMNEQCTDSESDRSINCDYSDESLLFVSNTISEYIPDSKSDNESDVGENELFKLISISFVVGLNPNSLMPDDLYFEFEVENVDAVNIENIANDPNVLFVVERIHDNYQNQQFHLD